MLIGLTNKTILMILVLVFLLSVAFGVQFTTLATTVLAESVVGVEVGDWVKYDLMATFVSDDPNAQIPPELVEMNDTESIKNVVTAISGTKITFERITHYTDGNETKSFEYVNVDTGSSSTNGGFMFIPSNLGKYDLIHASVTEHYFINETIHRTYMGITRDINHLNVSTTIYGESDITIITANYYWDKATGILCERPGTVLTYDTSTDYTTSFAMSEKIVDTNIWAGKPDTQSPVAEAGQNQTVSKDTSVTFDASGCSDNVGIVSYKWDFGDGSTGTGIFTTHVYTDYGSYVVTLTVWDAAGNSNTDEMTVNVEEATMPPTVGVFVLAVVALVVIGPFVWRWKKHRRKR